MNDADLLSDTIRQTELVHTVARGSLFPPHDFGAVAVIDGTKVKLTPFRTANLPPPMAMYELELSHAVIDIAFSQDNSSMAVLHHGGLGLFEWQSKHGRSLIPRLLATYETKSDGPVKNALQVTLADSRVPNILYFQAGLKTCRLTLASDTAEFVVSDSTVLQDETLLLQTHDSITIHSERPGIRQVLLQTRSGGLVRLSNAGAMEPLSAGFPLQLPWVEITEVENEIVAFGVSRSGHLYANSRLLIKNCTSFLVTNEHLLYTTSSHFLKFAHLSRPEG